MFIPFQHIKEHEDTQKKEHHKVTEDSEAPLFHPPPKKKKSNDRTLHYLVSRSSPGLQ